MFTDFEEQLLANHPQVFPGLLDNLAKDEEACRVKSINFNDCLTIGLDLLQSVSELPEKQRKPVIIDIEINGLTVFRYAMPDSTPDNADWIERKKRVVKRFQQSSYSIGRSLVVEGKKWSQKYDLEEALYAAHGGCIPIVLKGGVMLGTITMSGLAQVMDHVLVSSVLRKYASGLTRDNGDNA